MILFILAIGFLWLPRILCFMCLTSEGVFPNIDAQGCESYFRCHLFQSDLHSCQSGYQFHFGKGLCLPDVDVWCQWQRQQLRQDMQYGSSSASEEYYYDYGMYPPLVQSLPMPVEVPITPFPRDLFPIVPYPEYYANPMVPAYPEYLPRFQFPVNNIGEILPNIPAYVPDLPIDTGVFPLFPGYDTLTTPFYDGFFSPGVPDLGYPGNIFNNPLAFPVDVSTGTSAYIPTIGVTPAINTQYPVWGNGFGLTGLDNVGGFVNPLTNVNGLSSGFPFTQGDLGATIIPLPATINNLIPSWPSTNLYIPGLGFNNVVPTSTLTTTNNAGTGLFAGTGIGYNPAQASGTGIINTGVFSYPTNFGFPSNTNTNTGGVQTRILTTDFGNTGSGTQPTGTVNTGAQGGVFPLGFGGTGSSSIPTGSGVPAGYVPTGTGVPAGYVPSGTGVNSGTFPTGFGTGINNGGFFPNVFGTDSGLFPNNGGVFPNGFGQPNFGGVFPNVFSTTANGGLFPNILDANTNGGIVPQVFGTAANGGSFPNVFSTTANSGLFPNILDPNANGGIVPQVFGTGANGGAFPNVFSTTANGGLFPNILDPNANGGIFPQVFGTAANGGAFPNQFGTFGNPNIGGGGGMVSTNAGNPYTGGVVPIGFGSGTGNNIPVNTGTNTRSGTNTAVPINTGTSGGFVSTGSSGNPNTGGAVPVASGAGSGYVSTGSGGSNTGGSAVPVSSGGSTGGNIPTGNTNGAIPVSSGYVPNTGGYVPPSSGYIPTTSTGGAVPVNTGNSGVYVPTGFSGSGGYVPNSVSTVPVYGGTGGTIPITSGGSGVYGGVVPISTGTSGYVPNNSGGAVYPVSGYASSGTGAFPVNLGGTAATGGFVPTNSGGSIPIASGANSGTAVLGGYPGNNYQTNTGLNQGVVASGQNNYGSLSPSNLGYPGNSGGKTSNTDGGFQGFDLGTNQATSGGTASALTNTNGTASVSAASDVAQTQGFRLTNTTLIDNVHAVGDLPIFLNINGTLPVGVKT